MLLQSGALCISIISKQILKLIDLVQDAMFLLHFLACFYLQQNITTSHGEGISLRPCG